VKRLYRPRGPVKIVRCPHCYDFFITYDHAQIVRCRFCDAAFQVTVGPKARKFRPPRDRSIAFFASFDQAQKALRILLEAIAKGTVLSNEEAATLIKRELEVKQAA
jgi:ribosomal protein S27E